MAEQYFDCDFPWEEAALARRERCVGHLAPPVEHGAQEDTKEEKLAESWESFYKKHENKFFKARSYLLQAFPVLKTAVDGCHQGEVIRLGELGCGTGSSTVPLLERSTALCATVVDVSPSAIDALIAEVSKRDQTVRSRCSAFVCDIVTETLPFEDDSVDFLLVVFTLSAISEENHRSVLEKAFKCLKPGGYLLFRDYGS